MRRDFALCFLLVLATVAVYGQVARHGFVDFDDDQYVFENPFVRQGLTWEGARWAFTSLWASNWHPLTWLSHMLDCEFFGLNAGRHHIVNVLLHILNTLMLYLVLKGMTGAVWRSAMVAALFALHPLHVESVAWVSERKDVLSTLFFLLTLWAYGRYTIRPGWSRYTVVFGFLALGLMAKPMLVTVPFLLLLLDDWPLGRFRPAESQGAGQGHRNARAVEGVPGGKLAGLVLEKIPLFVLAFASCWVTFVAQQRGGATSLTYSVPAGTRLANALVSYIAYLGRMVWPSGLAVFYPYRDQLLTAQWVGAAVALSGISVWVIRAGRRRGYLRVGWFWYLGTLVPVIGLVQVGVQSMADRYTYVPLIGVFVMLVWGAADLMGGRRLGRMGAVGLASVLIGGCMAGTWRQVGYWRDGVTLFEHTLRVTKGSALAHNNLGVALKGQGKIEEAIRNYHIAIRINPRYPMAYYNLGVALAEEGKPDEAIAAYSEAIRLQPGYADAHNNLGLELARQDKRREAIEQYREAIRFRPTHVTAHYNLGIQLAAQGQLEEAVAQFREADRLDPGDAKIHNNLGVALARQGKPDEAIAQYREAVRLDREYADPHYNLGVMLSATDRTEEALNHYEEVLRLDPTYPKVHAELGNLMARRGDFEKAVVHFREALRINAESAEAQRNLAMALSEIGNYREAIEHYREAIRLSPDDPRAYNNLAWIRATHPDPGLRNGSEAVELAEKACSLWGKPEVNLLDTLAAAYAEAGRFPDAARTLEAAVSLAGPAGQRQAVLALEKRLQGYKEGRPYREVKESYGPEDTGSRGEGVHAGENSSMDPSR